jgi:hypothetical protein
MSLPLDGALAQCDRHASIMNEVLGLIPQPLTEAHLRHATPELIRLLDPLGLRSTALQDTLGTHVLRQFAVQTLAEPVKDAAFMDVLNLLERRGARMADRWALQRSMRNILTHGYPAAPLRQALALSAAHACGTPVVAVAAENPRTNESLMSP